jgi:hypothetical protein
MPDEADLVVSVCVRCRTGAIITGGSTNGAPMADYSREQWIEVYQKALIKLEHAKMRGRIGDARAEIISRVEKLTKVPGLHAREDQAIEDALNALRFLEREEDRYDENQRRKALETAMRKLQSIGPKIRKLDDSASE